MDYFDDVFRTFLGLDSVNCLAVNWLIFSEQFVTVWYGISVGEATLKL